MKCGTKVHKLVVCWVIMLVDGNTADIRVITLGVVIASCQLLLQLSIEVLNADGEAYVTKRSMSSSASFSIIM